MVCVKVVVYIIALILSEKTSNLKKWRDISISYWTGIISIPIASLMVIILFFNIANGTEQTQILLVLSALILINMVSFQLYNYTVGILQEKNKKLILQKQNECYLQQLGMIQVDNANVSLIRHDIKNHLFALKSLYEKGEIDSCKTYFNNILSKMDKKEELCKSGNIVMDSIINYKLKEVTDVDICVDVCIPEKLGISDMDITSMIGNLLDNSVRAVKKVKEAGKKPMLHMDLNYTKGRLILQMQNSYVDVRISQGKFQTTKKERRGHGIGLESVQEVVDKYNGVLRINCEKNLFIVEVVLYCE